MTCPPAIRFIAAAALALICGCAEPPQGAAIVAHLAPSELTLSADDFPERTGRAQFTLENHGSGPIRVESAAATCGCAAVDQVAGKVLLPGESTSVGVIADLSGLGERESRLTVFISSGTSRAALDAQLKIKGRELKPPIVLHIPQALQLDGTPGLPVVETEFSVTTYEEAGSTPWLVQEPSQFDGLQAAVVLASEEAALPKLVERVYNLSLRLDTRTIEKTNWYFVPKTTMPAQNAVTPILVTYRPWRPLRVVPEQIFVADDGQARFPVIRRLSVFAEHEHGQVALVARADAPWLAIEQAAEVSNIAPARLLAQFVVTIDQPGKAELSAGLQESKVVLHSPDLAIGAIEVPVLLQIPASVMAGREKK